VTVFSRIWSSLLATIFGAGSVCVAIVAGAGAAGRIDLRQAVPEQGEVEIRAVAGRLLVRGNSEAELRISGAFGKDLRRPTVTRADGWSRLEAAQPLDRLPGAALDLAVDLVIEAPRGSHVKVEVISADVVIEGFRGRIEVQTLSGDVTLEGQPRSAVITTTTGRVAATLETPLLEIRTVSGIQSVAGRIVDLRASSADARLEIDALIEQEALLSSAAGGVLWRGRLGEQARARAATQTGSIEFYLPKETDAEVVLRTFSGELEDRIGPQMPAVGAVEHAWRRGKTPRRIALETFSGAIRLLNL
jgi:hypothetical protein